MARNLITLDLRTRETWRQWLAKHHASSPGIWLVRQKPHTGVKSMPYEDLVREALCFGWVDSLIKRLDDDRYAIKVTPRKPTSKWSEHQPEALERTQIRWLACGAGARCGSHPKPLCATSLDPGAAGLCGRRIQDEPQSLAALSGACPDVPASFRSVDSHRQATSDAGEAYSRVDCPACGRQQARFEIDDRSRGPISSRHQPDACNVRSHSRIWFQLASVRLASS